MTAIRHREPGIGNLGNGFHHSSYELAHTLGWYFSMDDGSVAEECGKVLELCANVRDVQRSLDFQDDMCAVGYLDSYVVESSPDVAGAAGVTVTSGHSDAALGVREDRDGQCGVGI
jgi:hypothetical protein